MAFGFALDEGGQFAREIVGSETSIQITADVFLSQEAECDLLALVMSVHLQSVSLQRMVAALDFGGAKSSHDKQAQTSGALAQMPEKINAGGICPVEVLEEHDVRRGGRQSLQGVAHFAQHAFLARTNRLAL